MKVSRHSTRVMNSRTPTPLGRFLGLTLASACGGGAYWLGQRVFEAAAPTEANGQTTRSWSLPTLFPKGRVLRVAVDGGTLWQGGAPFAWERHGYYEVALDAGTLTWSP